jgi:hypothetical protein
MGAVTDLECLKQLLQQTEPKLLILIKVEDNFEEEAELSRDIGTILQSSTHIKILLCCNLDFATQQFKLIDMVGTWEL